MNDTNDTSSSQSSEQLLCPPSREGAVKLFIVAAILLAFGTYCFLDSVVWGKYPYVKFSEDLNAWAGWAFNFFGMFVFTGLGVIPLVKGIVSLTRTMSADAEGIGYVGKTQTPWSEITEITKRDVSKLQKKQILTLRCQDGRRIKLDGYKLQNFKELVALVEQHVAHDQQDQQEA